MVNAFLAILSLIQDQSPVIFYLIMAMMIGAAGMTYLRSLRYGLLSTLLLSTFFAAIGEFTPYVEIPLVISFAFVLLEFLGMKKARRKVDNLINWIYLYWLRNVKRRANNFTSWIYLYWITQVKRRLQNKNKSLKR